MPPIRVLQIVPAMNMGGLETFIMNVYRHIDKDKVQFDFLYHYDLPCVYDDEIKAMGGKIFYTNVRQNHNVFAYCKSLNQFFKTHKEYQIIHGHFSGFGLFYNHYAKKHGVLVRIGHSHNTNTEKSLTGLLDAFLSSFFKYGISHRFSCGFKAGKALYKNQDFEVFENGIELDLFAFDEEKCRQTREKFALGKGPVFGHIGRFTQQKNHVFLLQIFAEIAKICPSASLFLAGEGPLLAAAQKQAQALGIAEKVVFAGLQKDTPALYSAMDCFLLPSLFEGLPVVLVEAQANGLLCFVSGAVSPEAAIGKNLHFLPLSLSAKEWACAILAQPLARQNSRDILFEKGYDISQTAKRLQNFYLAAALNSKEQ